MANEQSNPAGTSRVDESQTDEVISTTEVTKKDSGKKQAARTNPVLSKADAYRAQLAELRGQHPKTAEVRLPLDKKNSSPLLVSVNGRRYGIQRGKTVTVPYEVAAVIERSATQDEHVIDLINGLVETYNAHD